MKLTRPLFFATGLAVVALGSWSIQAQTPPPAKATAPKGEAAKEKLRESRGLSAEQREKLDAMRRAQREKLQAIRNDASLTPEQKRAQARESLSAARTELDGVLTPEQRERFAKSRQHLRQRMQHAARARMHHRAAGWHDRRAGFDRHDGPRHGWGPGRPHPQGFRGEDAAPGFHGRRGEMGPGPGIPSHGRFGHPGGPEPRGFGFAPGRGPGGFGDLGLSDEQKSKVEALHRKQREQMAENMKSFQDEFRALLSPEQRQKLDARRGGRPPEKP